MKQVIVLFVIVLVSSCSKGFGNKLENESLDVYFEFKEDEAIAEKLGKYWLNDSLTGSVKQSIRLTKDDEFYFIQIIAYNDMRLNELSIPERKLLLDLQHKMDTTVFADSKKCQILVCNGKFETLFNINQ